MSKALKSADILSKLLAGHSEAMLLESGYTQDEIRASTATQVKLLIAEFDKLTPEGVFAEWLFAKQPIIHAMLAVLRAGSPRDQVAAAALLDRIQDSKLAKAMELGIVRPSEETKATISMSDAQMAEDIRKTLKELEGLGNSNIVELAPRRVSRAT